VRDLKPKCQKDNKIYLGRCSLSEAEVPKSVCLRKSFVRIKKPSTSGFKRAFKGGLPLLLRAFMSSSHDELTSTVFGAIQQLNQHRKANFLLDTALTLIDAGQ
jgi:hypothetical protein